jgi:hypothetical protein
MKRSSLSTSPPPRSPSPKHPLFTTKFFSTKLFGPGHLVGLFVLAGGTYAITKGLISHAQSASDRSRTLASAPLPGDTRLAQTENGRGQYGRKP